MCERCCQWNDCAKVNAPLGAIFNELRALFETIVVAVVELLSASETGRVHILSLVDHFKKYSKFTPLSEQMAGQVAQIRCAQVFHHRSRCKDRLPLDQTTVHVPANVLASNN